MTPHNEQISDDIDRWAHKRLLQWHADVMARYQMAELPARDGYANTVALLMQMAAKAMAIVDNIPPREAGQVFAGLVTHARRQLKQAEQQPEE